MNEYVLTVDQCNELSALGLEIASNIYWINSLNNTFKPELTLITKVRDIYHIMGDYITDGYELIPTYTLQDLIKILPKCIEKGNILYYLFIDYKCNQIYYRTCDNNDWLGRCLYIIDYSEDSGYRFSNNECDETASDILNACFKMIKYCLQNKLYEIKSSNI